MKTSKTKGRLFASLLCMSLLIGCSSGDPTKDLVAEMNKTNVQKVAGCYSYFQMQNRFAGPEDKGDLLDIIRDAASAATMEMMGIDPSDAEAIFVSENDGQEIKIRWGVRGSSQGCYEPVAFEATGVDGMRLVAYPTGKVEEVTDDQTYNDLFEGKYKPSAGRDAAPKFDSAGNPID